MTLMNIKSSFLLKQDLFYLELLVKDLFKDHALFQSMAVLNVKKAKHLFDLPEMATIHILQN